MPVMLTVLPPTWTCTLAALGTVSVVMMPCAASAQWAACASVSAAGRPAKMRSTGSGSMITPVENGSTCAGVQCSKLAKASQVWWAWAKPGAPVPALALPVLMTKARTALPAARCSRQTCTGAAQKRLRVNTPATLVPSSSKNTVRSFRLDLRTPACAIPMRTPAMGLSCAESRGGRFTGMSVLHKSRVSQHKRGSSKKTGRSPFHKLRLFRPACRGIV